MHSAGVPRRSVDKHGLPEGLNTLCPQLSVCIGNLFLLFSQYVWAFTEIMDTVWKYLDLLVVGLGESDALLSDIVDVTVCSDKGVAEDDSRSVRIRAAEAEREGADGALVRAEV